MVSELLHQANRASGSSLVGLWPGQLGIEPQKFLLDSLQQVGESFDSISNHDRRYLLIVVPVDVAGTCNVLPGNVWMAVL